MPIEGTLHNVQYLTDVSNQVRNEEYIADLAYPAIPVKKDTDLIAVYGSENLRLEEDRRADATRARVVSHSVSNTSYFLTTRALAHTYTQREIDNADSPISPAVEATENVTDRLMLRREVGAVTEMFTTTTFGTGAALVSTTSWRYNTTTTDPIVAAHSAASSILLRSAHRPNQLVMGFDTYNNVQDHVSVLDRVKYTQTGKITPGLLAALFDVDRLVIGTAVRDTGIEGISSSNSAVWTGGFALFSYVAPQPGLKKVSVGYLLHRGPQPFEVREWYDDPTKAFYVEAETAYVFKTVATVAGYLVSGANV